MNWRKVFTTNVNEKWKIIHMVAKCEERKRGWAKNQKLSWRHKCLCVSEAEVKAIFFLFHFCIVWASRSRRVFYLPLTIISPRTDFWGKCVRCFSHSIITFQNAHWPTKKYTYFTNDIIRLMNVMYSKSMNGFKSWQIWTTINEVGLKGKKKT